MLTLLQRLEALEARLHQDSTTSQRPPSTDSPYQRPRGKATAIRRHRPGGKRGHQGYRQTLLEPTRQQVVLPERCRCGSQCFGALAPYHTHQVLELPVIEMAVTHVQLYHGHCLRCGRLCKAQVPAAHTTGFGPRFTALVGQLAGMHSNSRRVVQDFCASVLGVPLALGTIQKVIDRVSHALMPHYNTIAQQARHAPVASIDETPWWRDNALEWLWVMVTETVGFYMIHPRRSKEAFAALIQDWAGIVVSDGYGVYQQWVATRQTCLAHLLRSARGLAGRPDPALAACGRWVKAERKRLCQMAHAPPTGGQWLAWYGRLCQLINRYHDRQDDAGRLVRRLLREMDSLWVFLAHHGVDATNNRSERALRCGVLWRKRSHGTASVKGNRWVERILSLKETCRLQARSSYEVLVDAVSCLFQGQQPDLAWITQV